LVSGEMAIRIRPIHTELKGLASLAFAGRMEIAGCGGG
jgi:hypothetical protein